MMMRVDVVMSRTCERLQMLSSRLKPMLVVISRCMVFQAVGQVQEHVFGVDASFSE